MGKYTKEIIAFLEDERDDISDWIKQFPLQDQPNIMREMKNYTQKKAIENGHYDFATSLSDFDEKIDDFENCVIDTLAIQQQQEENEKKIQQLREQMDKQVTEIKNKIIEGVLAQDENSEACLDLAKKLIHLFKENNIYDEEDWQPILHLL